MIFPRVIARRVIGASMGVIVLGLVVACAPTSANLRAIAESTSTPVAGVTAPAIAPGAPLAPQKPPVGGGQTVGAPGNSAIVAAAPAQGFAGSTSAIAAQPIPAVQTAQPSSVRGIVVSGTGQATARPDQATVSAGVQTRGRTAQEAQSANNQAMQAVIAAIKALGIPDNKIQTNGVSLYPNYDQGQSINGYNATNNVVVTVDNVDQVGSVLDAAVKAGANQATNVRFGFKDETTLRNKALASAAADARGKADALAAALGLKVSGIESVAEGNVSMPIVYNQPKPFAGAAASQASAPIEPGELNVTAEVTIVFGY